MLRFAFPTLIIGHPQATFYDKQWSATWEGVDRPSEKEK
jgi:hypothetical protein